MPRSDFDDAVPDASPGNGGPAYFIWRTESRIHFLNFLTFAQISEFVRQAGAQHRIALLCNTRAHFAQIHLAALEGVARWRACNPVPGLFHVFFRLLVLDRGETVVEESGVPRLRCVAQRFTEP